MTDTAKKALSFIPADSGIILKTIKPLVKDGMDAVMFGDDYSFRDSALDASAIFVSELIGKAVQQKTSDYVENSYRFDDKTRLFINDYVLKNEKKFVTNMTFEPSGVVVSFLFDGIDGIFFNPYANADYIPDNIELLLNPDLIDLYIENIG